MTRPRQIPLSPPADFPVYGLDASWPGSRWLESFGDSFGDPVSWLSLGHQGEDGEWAVFVRTFSQPRTDAAAARSGQPPMQDVAFDAAVALINATLPAPSVPRPDGMLRALTGHATDRSGQYAQWPLVRWLVDGTEVTARGWRFAGGWAAASDAVAGVYLSAVGTGTGPDPDGLSLAMLHDGSAYHFGLDQPLHPDVLSASRAASGDRPCFCSQDWHPDQLRVLRTQGP